MLYKLLSKIFIIILALNLLTKLISHFMNAREPEANKDKERKIIPYKMTSCNQIRNLIYPHYKDFSDIYFSGIYTLNNKIY